MEEEIGVFGPLDGPKKPCEGLKPSCLEYDPDPDGPDYRPSDPVQGDPDDGLPEPDGNK